MSQGKSVEADGVVVEVRPDSWFLVKLKGGHEVLAYAAGALRRSHIKVVCGDAVQVSMSPYDLTRGRVVYRYNLKDYESKGINQIKEQG